MGILFLTIGFAAFQNTLAINNLGATVRLQEDIRVTAVNSMNSVSDAYSSYEDYNVSAITSDLVLPNSDSKITYKVEVTNFGNTEMGILNITGLPSNLTYTLDNYTMKDKLCDDNDNTKCTLNSVSTLFITIGYADGGYDSSSTNYQMNLNFDFKRIFSITYKNIVNNGYPSKIMESESLDITFTDDIPGSVNVTGVSDFNFASPKLTITNPTNDVVISGVVYSRHYDELVFDGTNYIDTGIYLFSEENIGKNFEISFDLTDYDSGQTSQATLFNAMQEKNPYPGFVLRATTNVNNLEFNSPKIKNKNNIVAANTQKILLKRYNDVYYIQINDGTMEELGKYTGTTFDVPLTIGASLDGSGNPWRYFKGTLSNVNVEVTDPETYTVKFDANGGNGTMPDQTIRVDDSVNLTANTFDREPRMFDGWNTKADGSGTSYSDKQSVTNLAASGGSITLFAQWADPIKYYVKYNANGGEGTMPNQEFEYGTYQNLSSNTFTKTNRSFIRWNTKADGSGDDYEAGQSVKNLTKTENDVINLYAMWAEEYYSHPAEYVFTGSNYLDTDIYLYSSSNVSKDYEISFEIVSNGSNTNQATLMNAMYEVEPWPGVLVRSVSNSSQFEVDMNGGSGKFNQRYTASTTNKFTIRRKSGIIYVSVNDGAFTETKNHSSITTFDIPVTFGASMQADKTPQRYYKGTLKNMKVILFE